MFHELKYRVTREDCGDFCVEALLNDRQIGYANCAVEPRRIKLCDIRVHDRLEYRRSLIDRLFSGSQTYVQSFRRCGVGKALLGRVFVEVTRLEATEIWGVVVQSDLQESPFLMDWYQRNGFEISGLDEECRDLPNVVHKISKSP